MYRKRMNRIKTVFLRWMDGEIDVLDRAADMEEFRDPPREDRKADRKRLRESLESSRSAELLHAEEAGFRALYTAAAVISCLMLISVLLFTVASMPRYGTENPRTMTVVERYVEKGVEETGAINIVAGMILDYRAFDTLGESHVLFTALICVTILLRRDRKNMDRALEDYYTIRRDRYYDTSRDGLIRRVAQFLLPCILLYGIYILLNGQNSPGGGFSGGAVLGAGMILFAASFGFPAADRFFTPKLFAILTFVSLGFYSFAKGYVFFTGANGIENHIPKGTPGAILSGGLILPLDIAVGLVVACTMFGFYSLFKRGSIGRE